MLNYSTLAEDLASHGYVVVGFDAPHLTFEVALQDGVTVSRASSNDPELCGTRADETEERCVTRIQRMWVDRIAVALEHLDSMNRQGGDARFAGRLDTSRLGVFGHSFGGAVAAEFCHGDARCRAGADIDGALHGGVVRVGVDRPFLFLLSDHEGADDPVSRRIMAGIDSAYSRSDPRSRARVAIRGAHHLTFSDDGALLKSPALRGVMRLLGVLGIDGRRQLAVTAYCLRTFFDANLKGDGAPPRFDTSTYPELMLNR